MKTFVLRDDALLSTNNATQMFGADNQIIVPMCVIEHLQNYNGRPENLRIAANFLEYIDKLDARELTNGGVRQSNGSILRVAKKPKDIQVPLDGISNYEVEILQVCMEFQSNKSKVILISKDPVFRLKAKMLGIECEEAKFDLFPRAEEQYKGRLDLISTDANIDFFYKEGYMHPSAINNYESIEWVCNMFVTVVASRNRCVGRFDGEKIVPLQFERFQTKTFRPQNLGQKFFVEGLLTDWYRAPLVIAKGAAGTGKTFCSLAIGLEGLDMNVYSHILVAVPTETIGNEKLGFLPGDIQKKMSPYLGGIKDNLREILGGEKTSSKDGKTTMESGEYYFERGLVDIQPIGFLRGRTITNTLFIIDETQNIDPADIKSIVTRAAKGSKFVFLGDPSQVDNPKLNERYNGLVYLSEKMKNESDCWQITLNDEESVRGHLSKIAAQKL